VTQTPVDHAEWRLIPSERVLWHGQPVPGLPRDRRWTLGPLVLFALALVFASFAALLFIAELPGGRQMGFLACIVLLFGISVAIAPRYLHDTCEYLLTDRRVLWRRGRLRRSMDVHGIAFGRIRWHRSAAGVGHLELVRAVPFGPLARQQRVTMLSIRAPDVVLALARGAEPGANAGDGQLPLIERLDADEQVIWGGHPEGLLLGWRELATAALGAGVVLVGLRYGRDAVNILLSLEDVGLQVLSATWVFLFLAVLLTWSIMICVGGGLLWHGLWRSRALGRQTDYLLTDRRLLIRRGQAELSVDRKHIVDLADAPTMRGLHNVFLVLDGPGSRALADSGALGPFTPARDAVPPVLYELRDVEALRLLVFGRTSRPTLDPIQA